MAFKLNSVVPWGRNLEEYRRMFALSTSDMEKRIISFGDGPASFNSEMTRLGKRVVSVDPVYQFSRDDITLRIAETREKVMEQVMENTDHFVWKFIRNANELERTRLAAMQTFLDDFEEGRQQGRYIQHALPERTSFADQTFELAISSHFLLLYSALGLGFHLQSIDEMLRVSPEVRIFPILNLQAQPSEVLDDIIKHYQTDYAVSTEQVEYEFQKNGNQMLVIKPKP